MNCVRGRIVQFLASSADLNSGCVIAVTYLVLLLVSWKSDVTLVWIRRRLFAGLEFMFTYVYPVSTLTSDASNATTTLYHYTRERSGETTLYTNPYSFQGIYTIYVRNYRKWK